MSGLQGLVLLLGITLIALTVVENWTPEVKALVG
jgi:hypothetical protein